MQTQEGLKLEFLMSGDWLLLRNDGVGELNVRSTIKTEDGHLIYMHYDGVMHARPEIMQAMFQGQPIKPEDLYLRMAAFFETSSPQYSWMNKLLAVGYAEVALPKFSLYLYAVD